MPRKPAADKPADAPPKKRRPPARSGAWNIPPLAWILQAGRHNQPAADPQRILCANLPEAFALASHLRDVEVTLLETDEALAAQARAAARRRRLRNLRIEHGAIDQPALGELVGGNYDAVIAHDVLHRAADPLTALQNLCAASAPDGAIYLALRAADHPAGRLGQTLASFGLDREDLSDEENEAFRIARLLAALGQFHPTDGRLPHAAALVAGQGRPFAAWLDLAEQAGLHLRATTLTAQTLPAALAGGGTAPLASFSLPRLAALLEDYLRPPLVEAVFSRTPHQPPPWREPEALTAWQPVSRFLGLAKLEALEPPYTDAAAVDVEIHGVLPAQNFQLSRYVLEILRRSDGKTPLAALMAQIPHTTTPTEILPALHFLHHAFILELLPPT